MNPRYPDLTRRNLAWLTTLALCVGAAGTWEMKPLQAEQRVEVGVNDFTGKPIWMRVGMPHPVTVNYRGRDASQKPAAETVAASRKALAALDPAVLGASDPPKVAANFRQVSNAVDHYFLVVDGGEKPCEEVKKAVGAVRTFLAAVTPAALVNGGTDSADAVAKGLIMLSDAGQSPEDLRQLATPLYQAILDKGALRWKRRAGDLWFWNMGPVEVLYWAPYLSAEEKEKVKNAIYDAIPTDGGSNNNGRWGWIMDWPVALAFEDAEIMRGVIKAFKHWLGFNLYPSGVCQDWESYDYSTGGKESAFAVLAQYLEGLDPATFRTPAYPVADSTQRFGFEDTRNPRDLPGTIWKDMRLFRSRWSNHLPPDGRQIGINDTGPAIMSPAPLRAGNFTVASVNLTSSAILRGGPATDAALWGEKSRASDPDLIQRTFWAYLHADPSDAIHNHYDTNQLLLWWNGQHLAGSSGCDCSYECGIYNRKNGLYAMYTYSKNTVTIDQQPQYITHGQVIDFAVTPGFRTATTDAGYGYDPAFHQRTIAMLPDCLVDLNLLPARNPEDKASHSFDYMMSGIGEFDRVSGWDDFDPGKLSYAGHCRSEEEYLRWPNLLHIYPYIAWGRARTPKQDWDVTWGEDGRNLRMIVTSLPDEGQKACLGRAQLAHRGFDNKAYPKGHERLLYGVPKVVVRRDGPSASFLMIFEPHSGRSVIRAWKRLDERSCEIELTSGLRDLVFLRRKTLGHAWIRYSRNASCYDPPRIATTADRISKLSATRAQTLSAGDVALFDAGLPVTSLYIDYAEPEQRMMLVYAEARQPTSIRIFVPQTPETIDTSGQDLRPAWADGYLTLALPAGVTRVSVTFPAALFATAKAGSINPQTMAQQLGLEEVREATDDWKLNRSKCILNLAYKRPRVYADGAYDGMKGVAPWTAAISDDGEFAVVGSHEEFLEAVSPAGRLWRRYVKGKCLLDYNYAAPGANIVGRGHYGNPLAMAGDGSRIYAGTDAGILYSIHKDGHILWEHKTESRVQSLSLSSDASRIAVGAETRLFLLEPAGNALLDKTVPSAIVDVLLSRDGKRLYVSTGDGCIECFDDGGQSVWKYNPSRVDIGGVGMYRPRMVFNDLSIDAAGSTLVGCHANYGIYAFDARSGALRWRWGAESCLNDIVISEDGKNIACATDGELFYLDAAGNLVWKFVSAFTGYSGLRMSRDGRFIAIVNPTGEWFLLSRDKRIITRTPVLTPEPMALDMTPDGKRVVIAGIGYDVMLYENPIE